MRRTVRHVLVATVLGLLMTACGTSDDAMLGGTVGDMGMARVGSPADGSEASRTIAVTTLDTLVFEPATLRVDAGETVTFVVTNPGLTVHEFTLGDRAMQDAHAAEMSSMGSGMAHDGPNSVTVEPGEIRELTWRFGESGTVTYSCHQPGHYAAGMIGEIIVG
jgi:uncharacterized cupredoxin-like copper-binding protein